jgi:threonine/homoserine/homoserine lactone efflux protein
MVFSPESIFWLWYSFGAFLLGCAWVWWYFACVVQVRPRVRPAYYRASSFTVTLHGVNLSMQYTHIRPAY